MSKARWVIAGMGLGFAAAGGAGLVLEWRGPAAGGGTLDEAGRSVKRGLRSASTTVRDGLAQARTSVHNLGIEQQIAARIQQDKTLDSRRIEIRVEDEDTAILTGLVADEAAKEKAVELARDTRGVARVVDHLAVPPPPRVIAAAPDEAATPAVAVRPRR